MYWFDLLKPLISVMPRKKETYFCIMCRRRRAGDSAYRVNDTGICPECMKTIPYVRSDGGFEGTENVRYTLAPLYYTGAARKAFLMYKFCGCRAFGSVFGEILKAYLENCDMENIDMIIPIPLSDARMKERGYNQSALMAKPVADYFNKEYSETALNRNKNTKRQSSLDSIGRINNIKGAFWADCDAVYSKRIMLADDVRTSGQTLEEAARALIQSGARSVVGLTLFYDYIPKENAGDKPHLPVKSAVLDKHGK